MADPGFPVGGANFVVAVGGGNSTPDAVTFRKLCMSKRKNRRPWDPPMFIVDVLICIKSNGTSSK